MEIVNAEGLDFLSNIDDNSIDLVLTDPPYIISHKTGMDIHKSMVDNASGSPLKTDKEWIEYKKKCKNKLTTEHKENYLKYGSIYGKKYCVRTNYGEWDSEFTTDTLETFIKAYYAKLKKGGTLIIWFDLWKITTLKDIMERAKFKQIRMIEWIKTNPQPLNASVNYLTNCREIAIVGVKGGSPTFHSRMDRGVYEYPMAAGWYKFHSTQKNLQLFEELIRKHSNENDVVMDTFLGGGTTAIAACTQNRRFKGCEINKDFVDKTLQNVKALQCP